MNRRKLLQTGLLAGVASQVVSLDAFAFTPKFRGPLTIAQIMSVAIPAVKYEMLKLNGWATPELGMIAKEGRVWKHPLGVTVEDITTGKEWPVEQLSLPIVWSKRDDRKNTKEYQKINLVKHLLENAFNSHDDYLLMKLGKGRAIVSNRYNYAFGEIMEIPNANWYMVKMYTAIAFIE